MNNGKTLLWVSLVIAIIVAIAELFWLGESGLAWVILGLAVAVGLQAVYLLRKEVGKEMVGWRKLWHDPIAKGAIIFIAVVLLALVVVGLGHLLMSPSLGPPTIRPP